MRPWASSERAEPGRAARTAQLLSTGYPAYTTTPGWLGYDDEKLARLSVEAVEDGFRFIKLKVGRDLEEDVRRMAIARAAVGPDIAIAVDANQRWEVAEAIDWINKLSQFDPYWIEEPTSPDDVLGHAAIRAGVAPVLVATGEHVANRVVFKQMLAAGSLDILQIDATRVGGVNENIAILLLAAKFGVRVCPHAGGVGLCELVRHLSMFDLVAVSGSTEGRVIEYVDHLHEHFLDPALIQDGHYLAPTMPGFSSQMHPATLEDYQFPDGRVWTTRGEVVTTETRAARYVGGHAIDVAPVAQQAPGPGEVRIDVAFTGICGTDLHIVHGDMDQRVTVPAVLGHEMSGRIAEIGPGVNTWSVGDPVTVMPLEWCGTCPACLAGHQHICQRLIFVGIDSPGAMQSSWTVPSRILVRLPDEVSLRDAALVEPTAVAVHDVRRGQLAKGERVLVVGGGPVGLLVAVVAREAGGEVLVLEVDAHRRSVIAGLGFDVLDPTTDDVAARVDAWTEGAGVPLAFEVSGSQPGLDTAIDALAVRGRLVVVAIHPQARPVSLFRLFWRELTVIGARVYERADYERAVDLVAAGVVPADALISAVVPLSEAADAFVQLERGGGVMKVLIDCRASADA